MTEIRKSPHVQEKRLVPLDLIWHCRLFRFMRYSVGGFWSHGGIDSENIIDVLFVVNGQPHPGLNACHGLRTGVEHT